MMDAYSFDLNAEESAKAYQNIRKAYLEIFEILGLKVTSCSRQWSNGRKSFRRIYARVTNRRRYNISG